MPKRKAQKIADAADMIVDGFAMLRHELTMYAKWSRRSKQGFYVGK